MLEQRKDVRSPAPEEGAPETMCGELTTSPVLHPSVLLRGEGRENMSEVEPGKKRRMRGKCF